MGRWREETGANAVEFALVLPILLMLVFGGITGGLLYNQQQQLTHAAREGARYAATLEGAPSGDCSQAQLDDSEHWCGKVRARTVSAMAGMFGASGIERVGVNGDEVIVRVRHQAELNIIFMSWSPMLTGEAIARYQVTEESS